MNLLVRSNKIFYGVLILFLIFDPDYKIYLKEAYEYLIVKSSVGNRDKAPRYISKKFKWYSWLEDLCRDENIISKIYHNEFFIIRFRRVLKFDKESSGDLNFFFKF